MCRFLETIRVVRGACPLLSWHQCRFEATQREAWGRVLHVPLAQQLPEFPPEGVYKARLIYSEQQLDWSVEEYHRREIRRLDLVDGNGLDYHLKFADRCELKALLHRRAPGTEILIFQGGCVTDTSFSNVAFENEMGWFTPERPLLFGTRRAALLASGYLREAEIRVEQLRKFRRIALLNAMIPWEERMTLAVEAIRGVRTSGCTGH